MSVCQRSSVNIVLCSSNSSSSGSAVAARSAVYFPYWRTTSYQISRHCLLAFCPTTRSQRISRLLFSRLSNSGASACSQRRRDSKLNHSHRCQTCWRWLQRGWVWMTRKTPSQHQDLQCVFGNTQSSHILRADVTDDTVFSLCRHGSTLSYDS